MSAAPEGSTILVTGANGFIGSHVVNELLRNKYKVRGTVRSQASSKWMTDYLDNIYGKGAFTLVDVPDITAPGAFDEAVKGVAGVCHVASPVNLQPDLSNIDIAVNSTRHLMASAAKEPSVKRVVLTSSSAAATRAMADTKKHLDANTWNDEAVESAPKMRDDEPTKGFVVYSSSKTLGEKEAWRFMREEKPGFVFNAVLPNFTVGEILNEAQSGSTSGWVRGIWHNSQEAADALNLYVPPQWFVSVRDIARLHVGAVKFDDVKNERIFGFAAPFNFNDIINTMKKIDPSRPLPATVSGLGNDIMTVENEKAVQILNRLGGHTHGFDSLETAIRDNTNSASR